jgi:hypothetical protein
MRGMGACDSLCTIAPNSPKIPLDKHIAFVLRYTTLPKQSPSTEELGNTKRKNAARYKGLIFIASAPSQLNRDDHVTLIFVSVSFWWWGQRASEVLPHMKSLILAQDERWRRA